MFKVLLCMFLIDDYDKRCFELSTKLLKNVAQSEKIEFLEQMEGFEAENENFCDADRVVGEILSEVSVSESVCHKK